MFRDLRDSGLYQPKLVTGDGAWPGTGGICGRRTRSRTGLLRTQVTEGAHSKKAALAMAYKRLDAAQERWRRINGHELVRDVLAGAKFTDGIKVTDDEITTGERVAA
jgi:hypothetical protein